jgi:hypothetical protein
MKNTRGQRPFIGAVNYLAVELAAVDGAPSPIRETKMPTSRNRAKVVWAALVCTVMASPGALAQKNYDIGASDMEIKIGNTMPYSGPASAYGVIGKTEQAYFSKVDLRLIISCAKPETLASRGCRERRLEADR